MPHSTIHRSRNMAVTLLAPLVLSLAGCGSDPVDVPVNQLPEALAGTWIWVRATGGIAGQVRTPATEGFDRLLTFTLPGQVELVHRAPTDIVNVQTTFEFVPEMPVGSAFRSAQLRYGQPLLGFEEQWVHMTEDGILVLSDPCCDGFIYEFIRPALD